jgi:hypothetical protein
MNFNDIVKFFLPKDNVFNVLFEKVADDVYVMSKLLHELVGETDYDKRSAIAAKIEDLEHTNDESTHQIFVELGKNFITPFDREDIHALASALDDIADYIHATSKKITFYKVNPNDIGIQKMAELIQLSCEQVVIAVKELKDMKNIQKISTSLVKINSIENQADDIYDLSIERLFATEDDAKEVIKKREIYMVMETATDMCEDAANVIESIIVKYA